MEKWPILDQNHGLTPLENLDFFWTFLKLDISCLESVLFYPEYKINDVFWLDLPKNNQWEKWPFLTKNRKTWLFLSKNHSFLSRISKDDLFWLDWRKYHQRKKWPFFSKKRGLTPLEKFDCLGVFKTLLLQNIKNDAFWLVLPKNNYWEKWPFLTQNHGLTLWENFDFIGLFWNFTFIV